MNKYNVRFFKRDTEGVLKQVGGVLTFFHAPGKVSISSKAYSLATPKQIECMYLEIERLN